MSPIPDCGCLTTWHMLASSAPATVALTVPGLWLTALERGLMLIGLAIALGGLAGRGLASNYKGTFPAPLPQPWALRGSLLGLAAAAGLVITAVADPSLVENLARPPVPGLRAHATVVIAALELACFAVAAVLLRLKRPGPAVQPLLGVVLAESLRSHPEGLIPLAGALLTLCHLLPAVLWAGMLFYVVRAAVAWRADPAAMQDLIRLYANAAAWLFGVVVVTGLLSALLLVPLGSLLTTGYGRLLIGKAALVAVVAVLAIASRRSLRRRAAAAAGPPRTTKLEYALLAAVLLVTAVLTVITPPGKPMFTTGAHAPVHVVRARDAVHARPAARNRTTQAGSRA